MDTTCNTTTWRWLIDEEMNYRGDAGPLVAWAGDIDAPFVPGDMSGPLFTAWTASRVYFPAAFDDAEWCASAPREPCGEVTEHVGGA